MRQFVVLCLLFLSFGCHNTPSNTPAFERLVAEVPYLEGKKEYLGSPYVTAGDRVYMVGHQDGSFPELGWHIEGEMGGIWDHPIKLMDGFDARILLGDTTINLDRAASFANYPFANRHNFEFSEYQLHVVRWQFVPDKKEGISIQYQVTNESQSQIAFDFEFTGHSDLRPTWLGEETGMLDGKDKADYLDDLAAWQVKDQDNNWFVIFGANLKPANHSTLQANYRGNGISNSLRYHLSIPAGETQNINFTIAGSYNSKEAAINTFEAIQDNYAEYLTKKKLRYAQLSAKSKLNIPDKQIQETFEWLKFNCDWLIRSVPETGTGITAGIPDYPWWFGVDSEYALKGYMAIGQTEAVYNTIKLLDSASGEANNGSGRILHEMSTNGKVFNKGNINETPQFASLIREVYNWSGDKEFLKTYFPTVKKGLAWLMEANDANGNLFPDGFGMMEIHGLNSEMIDVASYTQRAFADAAYMAGELGETKLSETYKATADTLKRKINKEFWVADYNSYADFLGTDAQALQLIADAIVRADTLDKPWAVSELKATAEQIRKHPSKGLTPFVVHHNWVVNTPMEMGIADSVRAIKALETASGFVNPFGVFVTGIDRDASAGTDEGSFKGSKVFSYTGAVMTLPTGVLAVAENNYGRPDKALEYLQRLSRSFSYALPGSIYEVSPDYGMITQAWTIYSYAIPIIQQFFGIQPKASLREVIVRPEMPSSWDTASLENVIVADNEVSVYYELKEGFCRIRVEQTNPEWTLRLQLPLGQNQPYQVLQGNVTTTLANGGMQVSSTSKIMELKYPIQ